jgi:2-methylaconitate cis-trans-isomerase PrpF
VHIRNVNTDSLIDAVVETPGRQVRYTGDTAIDGVPGTGAPVVLNFTNIVGGKTGALLPTGNASDVVEGVQVTCLDVATPMVIIPASALGTSGHESKAELDADRNLLERLEGVRQAAARVMGMGDVSGKVLPKVSLIAPPRHGGSISSRYFVPETCHAAHAVSGAICVACCTAVKGSVADGMGVLENDPPTRCRVEHPSGSIDVALELARENGPLDVHSAGVVRTARKLFAGHVFVPASVWNG